MDRTWFTASIANAATLHGLDPALVESVVLVESSGQTDAFRFEPKFWSRYLAKHPLWKDENPRRVSASYGLMQILYVTATERGFQGLPEALFQPEIGLHWGCVHLAYLREWAAGYLEATPAQRLEAVLASYNGGRGGNTPGTSLLRNGRYAQKVLRLYNPIPQIVLPRGQSEGLEAGVHAALGLLTGVCFFYNLTARSVRRERHLAVNTVVYGMATLWELLHTLRHIRDT